MKKHLLTAALGLSLTSGAASAATITALNSSSLVIDAPSRVSNNVTGSNTQVLAFEEVQGLTLTEDLQVGFRRVSAGQTINSYMVLLNRADRDRVQTTLSFEFEFANRVLGLIADTQTLRDTNDLLGSPTTRYGRLDGIEGSDRVGLNEFAVSGTFTASQPGDWFRVITIAEVPVPAAGGMLLGALGVAGLMRKRRG